MPRFRKLFKRTKDSEVLFAGTVDVLVDGVRRYRHVYFRLGRIRNYASYGGRQIELLPDYVTSIAARDKHGRLLSLSELQDSSVVLDLKDGRRLDVFVHGETLVPIGTFYAVDDSEE